jgi:hypothetical protein
LGRAQIRQPVLMLMRRANAKQGVERYQEGTDYTIYTDEDTCKLLKTTLLD